jgi:hypothetical protein
LATATRREVVVRSLKVALVVGTLLALINHGDRLVASSLDWEAAAKIGLTYLVPYAVATWSAVQTILVGTE